MRSVTLLLVVLITAGGAWWYFHSSSENGGHHHKDQQGKADAGKNAPVPVALATAASGDVAVYLEGLGNVTPRSIVTVHTQINGELTQVFFQEGQMVKKGDRLAKIDDRPYTAQLQQAKGQLARDQALLAQAKVDLDRYQTLWKQDAIAKQQLDAQVSLVKQYEGAVQNDQGQLDGAKTNVIYTDIASPVNGRVGLRQVDAGNIVHTSDVNGIVVVAELQPITVLFTLPEDNVPQVYQHQAAGEKLLAEAWSRDNKTKIATGELIAIDNQVDPTTGTVKFRAEFANQDNALFPSQFVNIHLKTSTLSGAVLIPVAAVQRGTKGTFVYLVKPDNTVAVTNVTLGPAEGENVAVSQGIAVGDRVVVDGADALRDGAKIDIPADSKAAGDSTSHESVAHIH